MVETHEPSLNHPFEAHVKRPFHLCWLHSEDSSSDSSPFTQLHGLEVAQQVISKCSRLSALRIPGPTKDTLKRTQEPLATHLPPAEGAALP